METYEKTVTQIKEFINKNNLYRKTAIPVISSVAEDENPRVSKFGGKYPYLPNETIQKCPVCEQFPMMAVQLYIPSLPEFVQQYFQEADRKSLLVLGICPECLGSNGYQIKIYGEGELDKLVYHDDHGKIWASPEYHERRHFPRIPFSPQPYDSFDEQRQYFQFCTIESWKETEMVPYTSLKQIQELIKSEGIESSNRYFLIAHGINMQNNVSGNSYLAGWPHFCESDQTPDGYQILLNMCESEAATLGWGDCGTAQIWVGTGSNAGKYLFTCSSH
ncbi:hypothetical protein GPJ56_003253 [Histomonas meleagridis]|uniref:uncharacterized protein n=1 Tax=Histomonas meleagridis TaxID=135588 RepID=UPI0035596A99|nr:hypothetical protein GPJ56_003253 [Histomonas meleagridis]KAH0802419.1 hypothetical protein GO595_004797 [Histomonas meleagridis]